MKNLSTDTAELSSIKASDSSGLHLQDDGGNGLFIKDGGDVGIGTANPGYKLEVCQDLNANDIGTSILTVTNTTLNTGNGSATIGFITNEVDANTADKRAQISASYDGTNGGKLVLSTHNGTSLNQALTIKNNGYVGIGTTNPGGRLSVSGGLSYLEGLSLIPASGSMSEINSGSSTYGIQFKRGAVNTMTIKGSNVGVGHTSPGGLLHVSTVSKALSGTVSVSPDSATVTGSGTSFTTELSDGDRIKIGSQTLTVQSIASATSLTLSGNHTDGASEATAYTDNNGLIVTSGGNVGIGTTNPNAANFVVHEDNNIWHAAFGVDGGDQIRIGGATPQGSVIGAYGNNLNSSPINLLLQRDGGNVGIGTTDPKGYKLLVYGTLKIFGTSYVDSSEITSDDRVKHNEQDIVGAIETLGKITPKKYIKTTDMYEADHDFELDADGNPVDANGEPVEHRIEAGVIAQQVLGVPELAFMVGPEGVDEDGNVTSPHGLDYNSLFTYAIAAIQEQQSIIEDLKSQNESLAARITALEG